MIIKKEHINIVWFKRDLRLYDNEALYNALQTNRRTILLYVFEKQLIDDVHYSERHWNFIKASLQDMNEELQTINTKVLTINSDIIAALNLIQSQYHINTIYSHQETGLKVTYERDKTVTRYCRNNLVNWNEAINNGVLRGLSNREDWIEKWEDFMRQPLLSFNPKPEQLLSLPEIKNLETLFQVTDLATIHNPKMQQGGRSNALKYMESFFGERYFNYTLYISKPEASRISCSRLSPYLAWGNLSVREVWQKAKEIRNRSTHKRTIDAFTSRLRWQAHFIQKFEMEESMEFKSINKGYQKLKKDISAKFQLAWKTGQTGIPMVDASMRCLQTTGYLNFRMRAMLVSFFTHILWQPWKDASIHLSQLFLDFEPGIHFPQIQMQAGETGVNALRIYNPVKNGLEHDPDAVFIKKWVPELKNLEIPLAHEPYLMTPLEQKMYGVTLDKDYPKPIVDIRLNRRRASDKLWTMKKDDMVQEENIRILKKHTTKDRKVFD